MAHQIFEFPLKKGDIITKDCIVKKHYLKRRDKHQYTNLYRCYKVERESIPADSELIGTPYMGTKQDNLVKYSIVRETSGTYKRKLTKKMWQQALKMWFNELGAK